MHQHESTIGIRVSLPSWPSFPPPPTSPSRLSQSPGLSSLSHTANTLQYSCLENSMDGEAWRVQSEGSRESDRTEWLSVCPQGCEEASVPGLSSWLLDGIFQIAFPVCLSVFKFLSLSLSFFWLHWVFTVACRLSCSTECGNLSSLTRNWTCVPCIARQILNFWATGKSLNFSFL